jgi:ferredoxin-like protein FixX
MIANYGYEDGSGYYYISIDGEVCARCVEHPCVAACPGEVFAVEMDDYDDMVAVVSDNARRRLRELCSGCKGRNGTGETERRLPCTTACAGCAIRHSW